MRLRKCIPTFDISEVKRLMLKNHIIMPWWRQFWRSLSRSTKITRRFSSSFSKKPELSCYRNYFSKAENLKASSDIFQAHSQCYLFARDDMTKGIMSAFSNNVFLSPDMAHQLYSSLPAKLKNRV